MSDKTLIIGFVKPLVWEQSWEEAEIIAFSIVGEYRIQCDYWWFGPDMEVPEAADDPKAAAQADYEARIMSALEIVKVKHDPPMTGKTKVAL